MNPPSFRSESYSHQFESIHIISSVHDDNPDLKTRSAASHRFRTTQWGLVAAASCQGTPDGRRALAALCQQYWFPLYGFVRHQGYPVQEAEDLTQAFFAMILETKALSDAHPQHGKFRSFLLAAMRRFLINDWVRVNALKRGGGRDIVSLDAVDGEMRLAANSRSGQSPESYFDRQWAITVLNLALEALRVEYEKTGREKVFAGLQPLLVGDELELDHQQIGRKLNMSPSAVNVAIHRMRERYARLLRRQIAQTLDSEEGIEAELCYLFRALRA